MQIGPQTPQEREALEIFQNSSAEMKTLLVLSIQAFIRDDCDFAEKILEIAHIKERSGKEALSKLRVSDLELPELPNALEPNELDSWRMAFVQVGVNGHVARLKALKELFRMRVAH